MTNLPATTDDRIMWDLFFSRYPYSVVTAANAVGLFAALSQHSKNTEEVASELSIDARALTIHLGILAALGLIEKRDARWRATAAAQTWLHPQAQGYWGPMLNSFLDSQPLHQQVLATLKTGDRAEEHQSATEEWERGEMPAAMAKEITAFMNAHSCAASKAVAQQPLFKDIGTLLDVGGGSGIFSIEVAKSWPRLQATIMEIQAVAAEADNYISHAGIGERVNTKTLNMFTQDWPEQFDAHFFSNIFHDWSDATCRLLAAKSFAALRPGGTIILHEMLMDDDGCGPLTTACFSLLMLLGTKGKQYTFPELKSILASAGFVDIDSLKIGSAYYSLVVARKPE